MKSWKKTLLLMFVLSFLISGCGSASAPAASTQASSVAESSKEDAEKEETETEQAEKEAAAEAERLAQEEAEKAAAEEAERLAAEEAAKAEEEGLAAEAAAAEEAEHFFEPEWMLEKVTSYAEEIGYDVVTGELPEAGSRGLYYIYVDPVYNDTHQLEYIGIVLYPDEAWWSCLVFMKGHSSGEYAEQVHATNLDMVRQIMLKYVNF